MTSTKYLCPLTAALLLAGLPLAHGETLVPLQGQTQQQIQADIAACQSSASSTASSTTSSSGGERLRGAAKGAVAGAAAAEVRGQRHDGAYDKVDDDIKQEYRQEQARDTAKVGVLLGGCFLIGPKIMTLNIFTNATGSYLNDFVRESLAINPFGDNKWLGSWTIFYWAWWIAWGPFVGTFIARISKGRTIREFVLGVIFAPVPEVHQATGEEDA